MTPICSDPTLYSCKIIRISSCWIRARTPPIPVITVAVTDIPLYTFGAQNKQQSSNGCHMNCFNIPTPQGLLGARIIELSPQPHRFNIHA